MKILPSTGEVCCHDLRILRRRRRRAHLRRVGIIQRNAMHAVLYLILSLLALALVFYSLGAHFVAVLQVIVYAGAIMVLFLFVIMMLNLERPLECLASGAGR